MTMLSTHLWGALEEASGKPVKKLMESGLEHQVIRLFRSRVTVRKHKIKAVAFLFLDFGKQERQKKVFWNIPVGYTNNVSHEKQYILMNKPEMALKEKRTTIVG